MLVLMIADAGAVTYTVAAPVFVCLQAVHAIVGARCPVCLMPAFYLFSRVFQAIFIFCYQLHF